MSSKTKTLKNKWFSYNKKANNYNKIYSPSTEMATPTLDEVKAMDLSDHFWNMGALTHPDEPWAINVSIQKAISEYLTVIHCKEELSRIAREAQQAVKWAISRQTRLQEILELFNNGIY
jgi:hypothetical protein